MSSFDPDDQEMSKDGGEMTKYSINRLELSIKKFVKVLDIDLDRLYKHTVSITRLTNAEDWNNLHKEQVNASRTIQQIEANIREIEKARNQVKDEDLVHFDQRVKDVKVKALEAMKEFLKFAGNQNARTDLPHGSHDPGDKITQEAHQAVPRSPERVHTSTTQGLEDAVDAHDDTHPPYGSLTAEFSRQELVLHVVPQNSEASASWEELQENIMELNGLVHQFSDRVEEQGVIITNIEENIESSHQNIREGTQHLAKAASYKSALLPVVGAVVGGVVGGPIGFVAGLKLGSVAGVAGGVVGYAGGRYIKKHQEKISSVELSNLSDKRSVSLSDLPQDQGKQQETPSQTATGNDQQGTTHPGEDNDVFSNVTSSFKRFFSFSDE
ncbi:unnamed protein product [Lymnaea stagnalis]|uniref:t-SNARE coiled-coil homology domain-containing protein n=1 Tax=Lymnaea stagnalis TaxID=6523 RepID=A0AAV2HLG7_LYMST